MSPDVENVAGTQVGLGASDPLPKYSPLDPPVDSIASAKHAGYTSLTFCRQAQTCALGGLTLSPKYSLGCCTRHILHGVQCACDEGSQNFLSSVLLLGRDMHCPSLLPHIFQNYCVAKFKNEIHSRNIINE